MAINLTAKTVEEFLVASECCLEMHCFLKDLRRLEAYEILAISYNESTGRKGSWPNVDVNNKAGKYLNKIKDFKFEDIS